MAMQYQTAQAWLSGAAIVVMNQMWDGERARKHALADAAWTLARLLPMCEFNGYPEITIREDVMTPDGNGLRRLAEVMERTCARHWDEQMAWIAHGLASCLATVWDRLDGPIVVTVREVQS